jgi:hypothetical protein
VFFSGIFPLDAWRLFLEVGSDRVAEGGGAALIPWSGLSSGSQVSKLQEELWVVPPTEGA